MSEPLHFDWVDVFTDRPYAGNALAVFREPGRITSAQMQTIASELALSETTFVLPADQPGADFRVRIFTPAVELPMAGHPTLGTAFALARRLGVTGSQPAGWTFQEGVGPIRITIEWEAGQPATVWMEQPAPSFGEERSDRQTVAEVVGLGAEDLDPDLSPQVVSTGNPFLFLPIRNLEALARASLRFDAWRETLRGTDAAHLLLFTRRGKGGYGSLRVRMFGPGMGIPEDAATGAAAGPMLAYLLRRGLLAGAPTARLEIEQGVEMGRPSSLLAEMDATTARLGPIRVGGRCAWIGEGTIAVRPGSGPVA